MPSKGADILRTALAKYSSTIRYAQNGIAQSLKNVAQVMFADLGTRIPHTQHSFDTHGGELPTHAKLWQEVGGAVGDFYADLKEHGREDEAVIFSVLEFGRRIRDNGSAPTLQRCGFRHRRIGARWHVRRVSLFEGRRPVGW